MSLKHIFVGLSGGVDSAVAAHLLKSAGHKVDAVFMKNWEEDDSEGHCSASTDLQDAQKICEKLALPLRTVNFSTEYWNEVFEYFLREHRAGRTPNPDIRCNTEIKFKAFLDFATGLGAEKIATGHYARIDRQHQLHTAKDRHKDQSYFLHGLTTRQLQKSLFPLGELNKTAVRKIALELDLDVYNKKDSTGICFIGERKFRNFLGKYIDMNQGDIISIEGKILGKHEGINFYTIGQRQGLGIGGIAQAGEQPWYVVDKNPADNTLIVAQGADHPALFSKSLLIEQMHWISGAPNQAEIKLQAKIRYRQVHQECTAVCLQDRRWQLDFTRAQRAITPGQYAVLYAGEHCLGGGIISQRL